MAVTAEFKEASTRAAIRGLRGLEQTAVMLETYAPEIFPGINEHGQKHFGRVMMECAAEAIRDAWKGAIVEVEDFPDDPANLIEQRGKLRQALLEVAALCQRAMIAAEPGNTNFAFISEARSVAARALKSGLLEANHPTPNPLPGFPYTEEACPGHVASEHDGKVCGKCGVHIDSLRPEGE